MNGGDLSVGLGSHHDGLGLLSQRTWVGAAALSPVSTVSPQGMVDTAKKNFGGGNTAWEEKALSKYEFRWVPPPLLWAAQLRYLTCSCERCHPRE